MRAGFGLVGMLVMCGVMVWILSKSILPYNQQVIQKGETAKQQVNQIAGNSTDGSMRFADSLKMSSQSNSNGKVSSFVVTDVIAGGPADTYFGLKRGDVITEIEVQGSRMKVRDWDDAEMARIQVTEAYSRQGSLVVSREGQELVLPLTGPAPTAPVLTPEQQIQNFQRAPGSH